MNTNMTIAFNTKADCIAASKYLKNEHIHYNISNNQISFFFLHTELVRRILNEHNIKFAELPFILHFTEKPIRNMSTHSNIMFKTS